MTIATSRRLSQATSAGLYIKEYVYNRLTGIGVQQMMPTRIAAIALITAGALAQAYGTFIEIDDMPRWLSGASIILGGLLLTVRKRKVATARADPARVWTPDALARTRRHQIDHKKRA